jgi:hypothetical protein
VGVGDVAGIVAVVLAFCQAFLVALEGDSDVDLLPFVFLGKFEIKE